MQPETVRPPSGRLRIEPEQHADWITILQNHAASPLWIAGYGKSGLVFVGPLAPGDALRAFRLAGGKIPDGCELGPWTGGIDLFEPGDLPDHPHWERVEPAWLEPSVSSYTDEDITREEEPTCCSAPKDRPHVTWVEASSAPARALEAVAEDAVHVGRLRRSWNAHPPGSVLVARHRDLAGGFHVVDLPPEIE